MDLNPKDYRAWYGLGQTYELLHMPVYALHYYQRATQVCPPLTVFIHICIGSQVREGTTLSR